MPASGRFLLDTNIIIALLDGDETVVSHLGQSASTTMDSAVKLK